MLISDFTFKHRSITPTVQECIIISKEGVRFGCYYNSRQPAPIEVLFNEFKQNKSKFFIEVPAEIVKDVEENKPVIEINA